MSNITTPFQLTENFNTANFNSKLQQINDNVIAPKIDVSNVVSSKFGGSINIDDCLKQISPKVQVIKYFTDSQTWVVPSQVTECDVFLVGGGSDGSGGYRSEGGTHIDAQPGGKGGKILYIPNYKVISGSNIEVVVGTRNGGTSRFHFLTTSMTNFQYSSVEGNVSSIQSFEGSTSNLCILDNNIYGIPGAYSGEVNVNPNTGETSAQPGFSVTLSSKKGGNPVSVRYIGLSGGGASYNNNGGDAFYIEQTPGSAGIGADASQNTGNGGGGGGSALANRSYTPGAGGKGATGIVIIRYYQ